MLDARLKHILPPLVDAYLESLHLKPQSSVKEHLDLQTAVCSILYTLCKVRGYKIIVGFFNNEPRHFDIVLGSLERSVYHDSSHQTTWQVRYILLLWTSHLLLTPFDLASISAASASQNSSTNEALPPDMPSLAGRIVAIGLDLLSSSTKAQDGAAAMLVRLANRPDMQRLGLADALFAITARNLQADTNVESVTIYQQLGVLRFTAGIAASADLSHLMPQIYRACQALQGREDDTALATNAVAKKLLVKTFRNIAILSLHSTATEGPLLSFLQSNSVLEDVIDHLLGSLGDRDTPVRYAAAKAISLIVLELDPSMAHEVIRALLDTFKEDVPRHGQTLDFRTANALKWHGLTLTLSHTLFKRSAAPEQLPDIFDALVAALQFEQRTATGSSVGTNVRDAANFGIWSLSRRYSTKELLSVSTTRLHSTAADEGTTVIQAVATQLVLSACLDPSGNIRRGSSAALQEIVGRHPDEVSSGIALVQIVDYQTVGLRRRALVHVAGKAAELRTSYWEAVLAGLLGWRGLGSADVSSREAAADSIANLSIVSTTTDHGAVMGRVLRHTQSCDDGNAEDLHGAVLSLACVLETSTQLQRVSGEMLRQLWDLLSKIQDALKDLSTRVLRSELPASSVRFLAALCNAQLQILGSDNGTADVPFALLDGLVEKLMSRYEESMLQALPRLVQALLALRRKTGSPLDCIGAQALCSKVSTDGMKSTLNGAGRAIALGTLAPLYGEGLHGEKASSAITVLSRLLDAMNIDWRVFAIRAIGLGIDGMPQDQKVDPEITRQVTTAIHVAMTDYSIDERGDVGSLVRLQATACACSLFTRADAFGKSNDIATVEADVQRLSLEKLDRLRLQAAQCRREHLDLVLDASDLTAVSTYEYFTNALQPLKTVDTSHVCQAALLEGCISCAGVSAEPLLQASRAALANVLSEADNSHLHSLLTTYSAILTTMLTEATKIHPALELLAFILATQIPQRLAESGFKWRNLLSTVQKSHHKSTDIPRILAAVHVYQGLVDVPAVRDEVLKKLISMLKTNPYPKVRSAVAEVLFVILRDQSLKLEDWTRPTTEIKDVARQLEQRHLVKFERP